MKVLNLPINRWGGIFFFGNGNTILFMKELTMTVNKILKYLFILSIVVIAGCPNTMIGLGDKVDIEAPELSIGSYGDGTVIVNGDYVKGEITLTGTTSDDIGIKSVKLSFDGGLTFLDATVATDQLSWFYTIDTATVEDGEKDIVVLVSDTSSTPKTSEERLLLYFDNTAPIVMVTVSPGFASAASDSQFSIKGEATDPFRIRQVSVALVSGSGTLSTVEGTNSWSCVLSNAVTGSYSLEITAEDFAGNQNTHFFHYNDVNSLNGGTYLTIENLYKIENGESVPGAVITELSLEGIEITELPLNVDMNDDVPVITISNPEVGAQLGGNAIVIGRVEDDDAVDTSTIEININDTVWEWNSALPGTEITGSGQAVNFKYDISSLGNGTHTIQIRAEDDHGTQKVSDVVSFTIDLGAPQIAITNPAQGDYLNSSTAGLVGTAYDDQSVLSVKVQLDGEAEVDWRDASTANGFADWTYTSPALSEGMHSVKVYAEDGTGKISSYNISFYVDITNPSVTFNYPVKSSEVYGDVTVQGICEDNSNAFLEGFIKIGKDGAWEELFDLSHWSKALTDVEGTYTNIGSADDLGGGVWQLPITFKVTDIAGNTYETTESYYYFLINSALDKPEVSFTYPEDGFKTGGPVTIRGTSYDEQQVLRVEMRLDLNGDHDFLDQIILDGDGNTSDPFEDESLWNTVSGTLNWQQELNTNGELFAATTGGTGTVTIQVRAVDTKDGANPGVIGDDVSIDVEFDNSYPYFDNFSHSSFDYAKGTFTLTGQAHDPQLVNQILISYNGGTSYTDITGSSTLIGAMDGKDYSISQSINTTSYIPMSGVLPIKLKVVDNASNSTDTSINLNVDNILPTGTWTGVLEDINGTTFNVQGQAIDSGTVSGIDKIEVYFVRAGNVYNSALADISVAVGANNFGDGNGSVPYPSSDSYKIIINDPDELGNDSGVNGDLDGYNESLTLSGSTYSWWAELNSENIPDGTIDLHYVVWDKAGNAHHYLASGFIKNHKPVITATTVGTDLDWSGIVEAGEQFGYTASFNAQNRLYLSITVNDNYIPGLSYKLFQGINNTGTLLSTNPSSTIDISVPPYVDGSESFYYEVTDSDGITTSQLINVIIDNTDDIYPTISIDALTQGNVIAGHLEESGSSLHNGTDPDVSGQMTITGNAWDNQRIKNIKLTLDGVGTDHILASWVGNALVSQDGNFVIDTYNFSEYTGLLITWTYAWNSATVAGVAQNNVPITFSIEDYALTPNTASDSMTVDVVPYITDITTGMENGTLSFIKRSALGRYPVSYSASNTIRISGYNLYPDPDTVAYPSDLVTIGSNSVAITARDAVNYSYVDVIKDSTKSGELTVITHGISSINNINDNSKDYNSEASAYKPGMTDDRYMYFWQLDSKTAIAGKTEAVMRPVFSEVANTESTDMNWYYVENGQSVNLNSTQLANSWSTMGGDFYINEDGTPIYIYLHNMNWNSGQTNYAYYGSVQWGKDETYESEAFNWHRLNQNRLGIGNLSFNGDANYAYNSVVMNRNHNLQIITDGGDTNTDNYIAYYDVAGESQSIVFFAFKTGSALSAGDQITNMAGGWTTNLSKYTPSADTNYPGTSYNVGLITPYNDGVGYTGTGLPTRIELTSGGADSEHFDIAWDENGVGSNIYMAYYDGSASELKFMYNSDPVNNPSAWLSRATPLDTGAGLYVDMIVDPDHGVHLSYYDGSNSNLKYTYLPSFDCLDSEIETYTIDALFTNGMYNSIAIKDFDETVGADYRPVISNYSLSFSGTKYALRAAWPVYPLGDVNFANGASYVTGQYTGAWEVTSVSASTAPSESNAYIGINSTRDTSDPLDIIDRRTEGPLVIGYNGSFLEEATLLEE
jgi:hypothetical protein